MRGSFRLSECEGLLADQSKHDALYKYGWNRRAAAIYAGIIRQHAQLLMTLCLVSSEPLRQEGTMVMPVLNFHFVARCGNLPPVALQVIEIYYPASALLARCLLLRPSYRLLSLCRLC